MWSWTYGLLSAIKQNTQNSYIQLLRQLSVYMNNIMYNYTWYCLIWKCTVTQCEYWYYFCGLDTNTSPLLVLHTYTLPVLSTAIPWGLGMSPIHPKNSPSVVNIMTLCLCESVTYMMSLESIQMPRGQANWWGFSPLLPKVARCLPSGVNFSTLPLWVSVTYTIPLVSIAMSVKLYKHFYN